MMRSSARSGAERMDPEFLWRLDVSEDSRLCFPRFNLAGDPAVDFALEDGQWQGAIVESGVMELANIESDSQCGLGSGPQLFYFQLAQFVCEGLRRPDDVAIDFNNDVVLGFSGVFEHVLDRLLSSPAEGVNPRVDDKSA